MKRKDGKDTMPRRILPMLCTLMKEVPGWEGYLYEIKWDGYRIIAYKDGPKVRMDSRGGLNYTSKYPPLAEALQALKHDVVLDGEVVVLNDRGQPDFDALQKYNGHNTPIYYYVFDLLWLDGNDLTGMPLHARKELLQMLLKENEVLHFSDSFDNGHALYGEVLKLNLEGVVGKRRDSLYVEGSRTEDWIKVPTRKRQEFVIGGWAESDKSRAFKSLLFGAYKEGKLEWIGRSGGGYKEREMPAILQKLKALETALSPFVNKVLDTKGAVTHWVQPTLVANFEFATWTKSGRIRKPATFLGFRYDKDPKEVVREVPEDERQPLNEIKTATKPRRKQNKNCST
ncbi:MAG TPA: non-homologous end-joining DNA ligase [Sphingobacterium sp.]|nr:non-homologous end-joining DNA ligase [Sphingobacterium sp.]